MRKGIKGFTLLETIIVLAIFAVLLSLGLFMSMDVYKGYANRSQRDTLLAILVKARSRAMDGIAQSAWGVCFDSTKASYALFKEAVYQASDPLNTFFSKNKNATVIDSASIFACSSGGIIFASGSGNTSNTMLTITEPGHNATITIYETGAIE